MLPTSTTNDPNHQRRRIARRSASSNGGPQNSVATFMVALDSPAERVAARKHKLKQGRGRAPQQQQSHQEAQSGDDSDDYEKSPHHKSLVEEDEEEEVEEADRRFSSGILTSLSTSATGKKHLHSSTSTRSLDSAADFLDKERIEHLRRQHQEQEQQQQRQSNSQQRRQSLQQQVSSSNAALRASISDFKKSMFRLLLPSSSKKPNSGSRGNEQFVKAASERSSRTSVSIVDFDDLLPNLKHPAECQSGHTRSSRQECSRQERYQRRGSDSEIFFIPLDNNNNNINIKNSSKNSRGGGSAGQRLSRSFDGDASAGSFTSPGIVKKLWRKQRQHSMGSKSLSSRQTTSLAVDTDRDSRSSHDLSLRRNFGSITASTNTDTLYDSSESSSHDHCSPHPYQQPIQGKQGNKSSLTSVLSSKLKRKAKRSELVQELSSKDSLRVRDRRGSIRTAAATTILDMHSQHFQDTAQPIEQQQQQHRVYTPPATPQQHEEFSIEDDSKLPAFPQQQFSHTDSMEDDSHRSLFASQCSNTTPFTASVPSEAEAAKTAKNTEALAALLTSPSSSSDSDTLVEVEVPTPKKTSPKRPTDRSKRKTEQGHSSWPATPKDDKKLSRKRSSSVPPKEQKSNDKSRNKKSREIRASSERDLTLSKHKRSSSKDKKSGDIFLSKTLQLSDSTLHRKERKHSHSPHNRRRRSSSLDPTTRPSSRRLRDIRALDESHHGTTRKSRHPSSTSKPSKEKEIRSTILHTASEYIPKASLDSSSRRSLSGTAKSKSKRNDDEKKSLQRSSKVSTHPRRKSSSSLGIARDNDKESHVSKRPSKSPARKKSVFEGDASQLSLNIADIDLIRSLDGESKKEGKHQKKPKSQMKDVLLASVSESLHHQSFSVSNSSKRKSLLRNKWHSESSGLYLSEKDLPRDSNKIAQNKELEKKREGRTDDKTSKRSGASKIKEGGSLGKSQKKSRDIQERKKIDKELASSQKKRTNSEVGQMEGSGKNDKLYETKSVDRGEIKVKGNLESADLHKESSKDIATVSGTFEEADESVNVGEETVTISTEKAGASQNMTAEAETTSGTEEIPPTHHVAGAMSTGNVEKNSGTQHDAEPSTANEKSGSIADFLNRYGELKKARASQIPANEEANHDSLPSLVDYVSVDASTDSSWTNTTASTGKRSHVRSRSSPSMVHQREDAIIRRTSGQDTSVPEKHWSLKTRAKGNEATSSKVVAAALSRVEPSLKAERFNTLDAIADGSKVEVEDDDLEGPKARDSLDVMRLREADIFHDSPSTSPRSTSLPHMWASNIIEENIIERLAASMPNLEYHHTENASASGDVSWESTNSRNKTTPKLGSTDIFQDDSDNSSESPDLPELEPIFDENDLNAMAEIADQVEEERHQPTSGISSHLEEAKDDSECDSVLTKLIKLSPERTTQIAVKGARKDFKSPRKAESCSDKEKLDRGPRKPQRRSDSFEGETDTSNDPSGKSNEEEMDSSLELDQVREVSRSGSSGNMGGSAPPILFASTSMEFHRTDDKGWVQKPPNNSELAAMSSSAPDVHAGILHDGSRQQQNVQEMTKTEAFGPFRRVSSMSDLQGAGSDPFLSSRSDERWKSSVSRKEDTPPSLSRNIRHPVSEDDEGSPTRSPVTTSRLSVSMDGDDLRQMFSLPKGTMPGGKSLQRTYLPVSLQSAARRHERAGKKIQGASLPHALVRNDSPFSAVLLDDDDDEDDAIAPPPQGESSIGGVVSADTDRNNDAHDDPRSDDDDQGIAVETGLSGMFEMIGELEEDLVKFENQVAFLRAQKARHLELSSVHLDSENDGGADADE